MRRATCREASILLPGMSFRHFTSLSRAILKLTRSASNSSSFLESTQIQATRHLTWAIASSKASAQTSKSLTVRSLFTSVSRWGKQVSSRRTSLRLCLTDLRRWCLIRSWLRKTSLITTSSYWMCYSSWEWATIRPLRSVVASLRRSTAAHLISYSSIVWVLRSNCILCPIY